MVKEHLLPTVLCRQLQMEGKRFGKVSAVRPRIAQDSEKQTQTKLSAFQLSSRGHSGSYKESLKDPKWQWQMKKSGICWGNHHKTVTQQRQRCLLLRSTDAETLSALNQQLYTMPLQKSRTKKSHSEVGFWRAASTLQTGNAPALNCSTLPRITVLPPWFSYVKLYAFLFAVKLDVFKVSCFLNSRHNSSYLPHSEAKFLECCWPKSLFWSLLLCNLN